jgi:uncharacterized membrane protein YhaH (DUF805 family)
MAYADAVETCFGKSFTISGRASRSEYWFFQIGILYFGLVLSPFLISIITDFFVGYFLLPIFTILMIITIPANICVSVRRLHDLGKSGWMLLLMVIPLVNLILMILWFIVDAGQPHANSYGDVPTNTAG